MSSSLPFCNNLRLDDPVHHVPSSRTGIVVKTPRESSRTVLVKFTGDESPRRLDVMDLRYIVDGKPEDAPPIEGEPPPREARPHKLPAEEDSPAAALKRQRDKVVAEMDAMSVRHKALRTLKERLDGAIKLLESPE